MSNDSLIVTPEPSHAILSTTANSPLRIPRRWTRAGNIPLLEQVVHDRAFASSDVSAVNVLCTVETHDRAHLDELLARLQERGVAI